MGTSLWLINVFLVIAILCIPSNIFMRSMLQQPIAPKHDNGLHLYHFRDYHLPTISEIYVHYYDQCIFLSSSNANINMSQKNWICKMILSWLTCPPLSAIHDTIQQMYVKPLINETTLKYLFNSQSIMMTDTLIKSWIKRKPFVLLLMDWYSGEGIWRHGYQNWFGRTIHILQVSSQNKHIKLSWSIFFKRIFVCKAVMKKLVSIIQ